MTTKENQRRPSETQYTSWVESAQIQNYLRRHGLVTHGDAPLQREEIDRRFRQIDEQNAMDLISQSVLENALGVDRSSKKPSKNRTTYQSKQSSENNPHVTIHDNACGITLRYSGPKISKQESAYQFKVQGDEVLVMQSHTSSGSAVIFKGCLQAKDEFTFKSHRLIDRPFAIAIYINGLIDSHLTTCCEHGFQEQSHIQLKRSFCQFVSITGGAACDTCQFHALMESSPFDEVLNPIQVGMSVDSSQTESMNTQSSSATNEPLLKKTKTDEDDHILTQPTEPAKVSGPLNTSTITLANNDKTQPLEPTSNDSKQGFKENMEKTQLTPSNKTTEKVIDDQSTKESNEVVQKSEEHGMIPASALQHKDIDKNKKKISTEDKPNEVPISEKAKEGMKEILDEYHKLLVTSSAFHSQPNETKDPSEQTTTANDSESNSTIKNVVGTPLEDSQRETKYQEKCADVSPVTNTGENVETFSLIWLDETIGKNFDTLDSAQKLRVIANSLQTCETINEAIALIEKLKQQQVYLIISGELGDEFIPSDKIDNLLQLNSIYIFCKNKEKYNPLKTVNAKVREVFNGIDALCERLKSDTEQALNNLLPMSVTSGTSESNRANTDQNEQEREAKFLCSQLHRDLLFTMEYSDDARLDLIRFCSKIYQTNKAEREYVKELEKYHAGKAVWWYTRHTFLYKMLNSALYRQDMSMLYKFHFFIKDLHMQLEQLHSLYKPSLSEREFIVYRGLTLTTKVFNETIRQQQGSLIAFDSFLSTTLKEQVAKNFALMKKNTNDQSILLRIKIDADTIERPFADISRLSAISREGEILFSIGTVFRIDDVEDKRKSGGYWLVHLSSISKKDEQLKRERKEIQSTLFEFFKEVQRTQDKSGDPRQKAANYINLASMYYKQEEYQNSLLLYEKAHKTLSEMESPNPLTLATYEIFIAMTYEALANCNETLKMEEERLAKQDELKKKEEEVKEHREEALKLSKKASEHRENASKFAEDVSKQRNDALKLYEKALETRRKGYEPYDPLVISTLHTIGRIYDERGEWREAQKRYSDALEWQQLALKSPQEWNPTTIAVSHICIANTYHQQEKFEDALTHFKKALEQQNTYLSTDHPVLAFLYHNIGSMYYRLNKYDQALRNYQTCLEIEERSQPAEHKTLAETYRNIGNTYEKLAQRVKAIEYAEKALEILKRQKEANEADIKRIEDTIERLRREQKLFN